MATFKRLSSFQGIAVSFDQTTDTFFESMVVDALRNLSKFATGRKLLSEISKSTPGVRGPSGVNVVVEPTEEKLKIILRGAQHPTDTPESGLNEFNAMQNALVLAPYFYDHGDSHHMVTTKPATLANPIVRNAAENGTGSAAMVKFSNTTRKLNTGLYTPPFLGLGHELIHALHSLKGKNVGGIEEENRTVGIGKYTSEAISENAIRKEAKLPRRDTYP